MKLQGQIKYIIALNSIDGMIFLKSFNHEARDGRGEGTFTENPNDALMFEAVPSAWEFWRQQSKTRPIRPDGKPNRPLTSFTIQVEPVNVLWTFTQKILEGDVVTWDVKRIYDDAKAGRLGPMLMIPTSKIPPADWSTGNLQRHRVDWIKEHPGILNEPALGIEVPPPRTGLRCFCDGQHRITARQELGLPICSYYAVPFELERGYRLDPAEIARWREANMAKIPVSR